MNPMCLTRSTRVTDPFPIRRANMVARPNFAGRRLEFLQKHQWLRVSPARGAATKEHPENLEGVLALYMADLETDWPYLVL